MSATDLAAVVLALVCLAATVVLVVATQSLVRTMKDLRSVVDDRGQAVSALNRLNLREGLPILAIWGEEDNIIPVDHAYAALEARPDCRLEILPGVGHFAQVEAPDRVIDLLDEFISTTEPADPSRCSQL